VRPDTPPPEEFINEFEADDADLGATCTHSKGKECARSPSPIEVDDPFDYDLGYPSDDNEEPMDDAEELDVPEEDFHPFETNKDGRYSMRAKGKGRVA
jgi:hypothetical protein